MTKPPSKTQTSKTSRASSERMAKLPKIGSLSLFIVLLQPYLVHGLLTSVWTSQLHQSLTMDQPPAGETITILGFGSLLSERSSRLTFPDLTNFRLVRVPNHRRVFGHPASIFFQRKIADYSTLRMSSLSVEPCEGSSFIASAFEVPNNDMMSDGIPSQSFLEREEEFDIVSVPFLDGLGEKANLSSGIICRRSTDEEYVKRWGQDHFDKQFGQYDVKTIWNWSEDSGLLPCSVYLRHCYLAAQSMGKECFSSFLDETFLVDRQTKVRSYLDSNKEILETLPPPELGGRYSG